MFNTFLQALLFCLVPLATQAQNFSFAHRLWLNQTLLYEDTSQPGHYYYVPDSVQIALDSNGTSQLALNYFSLKDSINRFGTAGAILQIVLDFSMPSEKILALEQQLQQKQTGARIVGAIPFQVSQGIRPTFNHEQQFSFEFFPPASGILQVAMQKTDALLTQTKSVVFESIISFTYSVVFEGYAQIPKDSLDVFFKAASSSEQSTLLQFFLRSQTLNLFTTSGQKIILHESEIIAIARHLAAQFQQSVPAIYAQYAMAAISQNKTMELKLKSGNWSLQHQYHVKAPNQGKSTLKKSLMVLPDSKFYTRKVHFLKDGFESLNQIPPNLYNIDLKVSIGKRGKGPIYLKDSLLYDLKNSNTYIIEYPYFHDPNATILDGLNYRYFLKHYFTLGQFNALTKETQGANLWETQNFMAINIVPQFKTENVYIEFDHLERKNQGIQGLRIEFYLAKNKSTIPAKKGTFSELNADYDPGIYLGDAVLDLSISETFEKKLIFPINEAYCFFYKINWLLGATAPLSSKVLESNLHFSCNSLIYLELPDLNALQKK